MSLCPEGWSFHGDQIALPQRRQQLGCWDPGGPRVGPAPKEEAKPGAVGGSIPSNIALWASNFTPREGYIHFLKRSLLSPPQDPMCFSTQSEGVPRCLPRRFSLAEKSGLVLALGLPGEEPTHLLPDSTCKNKNPIVDVCVLGVFVLTY